MTSSSNKNSLRFLPFTLDSYCELHENIHIILTNLNVNNIPTFVNFHISRQRNDTLLPEVPREHVPCTTAVAFCVGHPGLV